jgi:hypothetical protein
MTVILGNHDRNPVSLTPATKPQNLTQKPGFFFGILQLSLESNHRNPVSFPPNNPYHYRMAIMSIKDSIAPGNLSESEIDDIVIEQAEDDSAWDSFIEVRKKSPTAVSLPVELAARAAFFAKVHREPALETWITRIIRERIELEEAAFLEMKRLMSR